MTSHLGCQDNPRNFESTVHRYEDLGGRRNKGGAGEGTWGWASVKCLFSIGQGSPDTDQWDMDGHAYVITRNWFTQLWRQRNLTIRCLQAAYSSPVLKNQQHWGQQANVPAQSVWLSDFTRPPLVSFYRGAQQIGCRPPHRGGPPALHHPPIPEISLGTLPTAAPSNNI